MIDPATIYDPVGRLRCFCGGPMVVRSTFKHPLPDGSPRRFLGCLSYPRCDGTAALHPDGRLMSTPADQATRQLRNEAHAVIDPLWQRGAMTRVAVYVQLAAIFGLTRELSHIGYFDAEQCRRAIEHFSALDAAEMARLARSAERQSSRHSRVRGRDYRQAVSTMRLQRRILELFGGMPEVRLFRANVGVARPLSGGPPIKYGTNGQADLIGWVRPSGRFLGIETKSPTGRLRPEQKAWGDKLTADGGIYVVARSTDDVYVALAAAGVVLSMVPPGVARATAPAGGRR